MLVVTSAPIVWNWHCARATTGAFGAVSSSGMASRSSDAADGAVPGSMRNNYRSKPMFISCGSWSSPLDQSVL